jgi:hypothetical protein
MFVCVKRRSTRCTEFRHAHCCVTSPRRRQWECQVRLKGAQRQQQVRPQPADRNTHALAPVSAQQCDVDYEFVRGDSETNINGVDKCLSVL